MRMQTGEADLALPRFARYLSTGTIVDRLVGDRRPAGDDGSSAYYTDAQRAASALPEPPGRLEFAVGPAGRLERQCPVVVSIDSDFCALLVYRLALEIAGRSEQPAVAAAHVLPHAPLLLRGPVYTKSRARVARGERRTYYPESAAAAQPLLLSYELFDPAVLYAEITRTGPPLAEAPVVAAVRRDADERQARAAARRAASLAARRAAPGGGEPAAKRARVAADEDDEPSGLVLHLPPLAVDASADVVFERAASFVMATCALGNDYLAGFVGCPRRWSYAALVDGMHRWPTQPLVRLLRADGDTRPPASLPMIIDFGAHERFVGAAYYMNLLAQACSGKPTAAPDAVTIEQIAALVSAKYSGRLGKTVPPREHRERMAIRLLWMLAYFTHGPNGLRGMLDPREVGWELQWSNLVV